MLYKCLMVGVILLCCGGIGQALVEQKQKLLRYCKRLLQGCIYMGDQMAVQGRTLPQAAAAASEKTGLPLFVKAVELRPMAELLKESDIVDANLTEWLENFFDGLRGALTHTHLRNAEQTFRQAMEQYITFLQQEQQDKRKIIRAVSISVGLMIAVTLL